MAGVWGFGSASRTKEDAFLSPFKTEANVWRCEREGVAKAKQSNSDSDSEAKAGNTPER